MRILNVLAIMLATLATAKTAVTEPAWVILFIPAAILALIDFFNKE